ncbi:MAG: AbrB/MazE/SpoVT family DNA-binding domain-containing protein [Christensenellaceae bacterium]|jgi:AbrB family transcriptional regulator (stage V sporulation protein T)|nr:AbrB/MazE/SpoVT family DNA-binding domain-containing protein [Christensenellaceae bacterium]
MKKVSGIVRKLDELGRIVVPKEIRRTLNLREGSDIEIILSDEELILRKFSRIFNIKSQGEQILESLYEIVQCPCIMTDNERVILAKGAGKKDMLEQKLTKEFCDITVAGEYKDIQIISGRNIDGFVAPVFSQGFWCGSIAVLGDVGGKAEVINFAANYLSGLLV